MVSNLPYNVGTLLVLDILRHVPRVTRMVVMVQREVADRLVASPGSRTYGLPSVVSQLHGVVKMAFVVPPQVFVPAPNVGSAVVVIDRRPSDSAAEEAIRIAAAAFGQRRKMLRSTLAGVIERPTEVLEAVGIDPTSRPEDLGPDQFLALAREATHG
jgi:16S rRNA (adenine1518-N6/adenine1519-N6)-dimethyltransferase